MTPTPDQLFHQAFSKGDIRNFRSAVKLLETNEQTTAMVMSAMKTLVQMMAECYLLTNPKVLDTVFMHSALEIISDSPFAKNVDTQFWSDHFVWLSDNYQFLMTGDVRVDNFKTTMHVYRDWFDSFDIDAPLNEHGVTLFMHSVGNSSAYMIFLDALKTLGADPFKVSDKHGSAMHFLRAGSLLLGEKFDYLLSLGLEPVDTGSFVCYDDQKTYGSLIDYFEQQLDVIDPLSAQFTERICAKIKQFNASKIAESIIGPYAHSSSRLTGMRL